jgi:acetyltransferase-like isoleucine patch superfamily enzyme
MGKLASLTYAAHTRLSALLCTLIARMLLFLWGAKVGQGLKVRGWLRLVNHGSLRMGSAVVINSGSYNFVGIDRRVSLWVGPAATIEIGDGCAISNSTFVALDSITLLPGTFVGGGCDFLDSDFHPLDAGQRKSRTGTVVSRGIVIGPDAFIGAHTIVLKGVTIGRGAVVGAGSLVASDIPDGEIWAGRPARRIG